MSEKRLTRAFSRSCFRTVAQFFAASRAGPRLDVPHSFIYVTFSPIYEVLPPLRRAVGLLLAVIPSPFSHSLRVASFEPVTEQPAQVREQMAKPVERRPDGRMSKRLNLLQMRTLGDVCGGSRVLEIMEPEANGQTGVSPAS
jgi:hypothetical protein